MTETCVDPALSQPYTDMDQQRSSTDPATHVTVHYRYIHGGFTGTMARFSLYFPAPSQYRGRFFEGTYPTFTQEDVPLDHIAFGTTLAFAISHGAYVVSTNNAGAPPGNIPIGGYRVNAASAKYSRVVAARVYGTSVRPRGYIYGASGGAYQALAAAENTAGVWDGAVPMVPGVPNAIPNFQAAQVVALRVLHDKLPQIADAMEPGGSGNPYAGLNAEQRTILREVTRLGFPLRGWWQYKTLNGGSFDGVTSLVLALDPTYVADFWTKPGYEGTNPASSVQAARIQHDATVVSLVGTPTSGLVLSSVPTGYLAHTDLVVTSGAAAGKSVLLGKVTGTTVGFGDGADPTVTGAIRPGDHVRIDNSAGLAIQYYYRYQVPGPDQYGWNQFRDANGVPIYPQRPSLVGPQFGNFAGGAVANGHFNGKMIMLASVMDVQAFPWSADWYRKQAQAAKGPALNDTYRLWYEDNADHGRPVSDTGLDPGAAAHVVGYQGELEQALLDLDAWVKHGTPPPASTRYHVDANDQVQLPASARRHGVQPVVDLSVRKTACRCRSASDRVDVAAGQGVTFSATAQVPRHAGKIVKVEWDFKGAGNYPVQARLRHSRRAVHVNATYAFAKPGTYFPVVRVTSQRDGDPNTPYGLIQNLSRVRVVVH